MLLHSKLRKKVREVLSSTNSGSSNAFRVDARTEELQVEHTLISGFEELAQDRLEGNDAVTRHRSTWRRAVAQDVVAHLNKAGDRCRPPKPRCQTTLEPAGVQIDADPNAGHFGQGNGVRQGVRNMDVDVQGGCGLDQELDTSLVGYRPGGGDEFLEPSGCLFPAEGTAPPCQHVYRCRPEF